ncbi:MAG TPA: hypothetical protein VFA40_27675 [Terriglobales bacterium]|nr:hypothetical protein [Terriglobales bacterium]
MKIFFAGATGAIGKRLRTSLVPGAWFFGSIRQRRVPIVEEARVTGPSFISMTLPQPR